jgi:hypothetical protein
MYIEITIQFRYILERKIIEMSSYTFVIESLTKYKEWATTTNFKI